jgi:RNA polymerase sigma factor (sigma-70 family)
LPNEDAHWEVERDDLEDPFRAELESAMAEVLPVLQQRIAQAQFGRWHRERGAALDLAQEAIFRLFKHCCAKRMLPNDPLGYAVAIARNLAKTQFRQSRKELTELAEPFSLTLEETYQSENEDGIVDAELEQRAPSYFVLDVLRQALDDLPPRQKRAVQLRIQKPDATDRELGARMNIGEDGFRKNCSRGFGHLRKSLQAKGINQTRGEVSGYRLLQGEDTNERTL